MNTCLHLNTKLAKSGASNGVGVWCSDCEQWATKARAGHNGWALPKDHPMLAGVDRELLPRVHATAVDCEICLKTTQTPELHHWCPKALYRDNVPPNEGPQAWLCQPCHSAWHEIVTPGLKGGMTHDRIIELLRRLYKRMDAKQWDQFVATVNDADAKARERRKLPRQPRREQPQSIHHQSAA